MERYPVRPHSADTPARLHLVRAAETVHLRGLRGREHPHGQSFRHGRGRFATAASVLSVLLSLSLSSRALPLPAPRPAAVVRAAEAAGLFLLNPDLSPAGDQTAYDVLVRHHLEAKGICFRRTSLQPASRLMGASAGANVSGGFAQSVALARVFVRPRAQIVILDESSTRLSCAVSLQCGDVTRSLMSAAQLRRLTPRNAAKRSCPPSASSWPHTAWRSLCAPAPLVCMCAPCCGTRASMSCFCAYVGVSLCLRLHPPIAWT